jgi:hypothetical protein
MTTVNFLLLLGACTRISSPTRKLSSSPSLTCASPGGAQDLHADEVVLDGLPGLCYPVSLRIVEFQDWSTPRRPPMTEATMAALGTMMTMTRMTTTTTIATLAWMTEGAARVGLVCSGARALTTTPRVWAAAVEPPSCRVRV